jgi:hypothetical protein
MIIDYPTYYLVPVLPVMSLDDEDYNARSNGENAYKNDEVRRGDKYSSYNDMGGNEVYKAFRNMNEDIFSDIDEEYVNDSTK